MFEVILKNHSDHLILLLYIIFIEFYYSITTASYSYFWAVKVTFINSALALNKVFITNANKNGL